MPTEIKNQKGIQLYVELNEDIPVTYEDEKNIQSDEETTGQSHRNNRLITSDVDEENVHAQSYLRK